MAAGERAGRSTKDAADLDAEILVVDDDESIRLTLGLALEFGNHRAALVRDGGEALSWLRHHRAPELILMDLMMPRMDGWQLLDALRSDPGLSRIPVVVITAFKNDLGSAATLPVLIKPIDLESLERVVAAHRRPTL
jgi:CheY-like chemotaxis protein